MSDLVERLRRTWLPGDDPWEAADEIERLQEALKQSCESARYNLYDCGFTAMQLRAVDAEAEIERLQGEAVDDAVENANLKAEIERLKELLALPYPPNDGRTHWENCYKDRGHHNCAVREIERLLEGIDAANNLMRKAQADHEQAEQRIAKLRAALRDIADYDGNSPHPITVACAALEGGDE